MAVPLTYAEIGKRFQRTSAWVKKVEKRALRKLKGKLQLRNLLNSRDLSVEGYDES